MSSVFYGDGYTYSHETVKKSELIPEKICTQCGNDVDNNFEILSGTMELLMKDELEMLILKKGTKHNSTMYQM